MGAKWDAKSVWLSLIPYSRKYWQELNFVVGSQMAIAKALADFNLAVRYGIAIRICEQEILADFNLAVVELDRQTVKFSRFVAWFLSYLGWVYSKPPRQIRFVYLDLFGWTP